MKSHPPPESFPGPTVCVALTGASGIQYGLRLIECLVQADAAVYVLMTKAARICMGMDTDIPVPARTRDVQSDFSERYGARPGQLRAFGQEEWTAPIASGSGAPDAMVVCPCTTGTLARPRSSRHGPSRGKLMQLPLFPLSSIVMPGGIMKLRLFERRYIDMVTNCFRTQTGFGICLIKDGNEAGAPSLPYPLGTRVSIVDFDQGDDGLLHIVEPEITFSQKRLDDPDWVCHRLLELLPLAPEAKYELLQLQNNRERLAALAAFKIEIGQAS